MELIDILQILHIEHQTIVATIIQNEINDYDAFHQPDPDVPDDVETPTNNVTSWKAQNWRQ